MKNRDNLYYKIKVLNLNTKAEYFHGKVPYEHVEMLKLNPNLEVKVLGHYREGGYEKESSSNKEYQTINI